ncbi:MAG TPA: RluA family pseudouridine synthase [Candidatus Omnitrophota bacterium]|nr:RluA family pseudouridine synthase [Candidatus Omnitrophota bacterium]
MEKKKFLIPQEDSNKRIDVFVKTHEPDFSRTSIQEMILSGKVTVNGASVKPHYKIKFNDDVSWDAFVAKETNLKGEPIPIKILYEDDDIIFIDKPSGMVVHPGAGNKEHTLVNALLNHTSLSTISPDRPGIVHRLDKDTSGVMVVAKTNSAHLNLAKQFKKHDIERRYIALVEGKVEFDEGIIDVPIKRHSIDRKKMSVSFSDEAKEAFTSYRVLKRFEGYTALELFPQTGRTHQLRVHLNYLGHPILGDMAYGRKKNFSRLALHAKDLGVTHPVTGDFMKFSSPLPKEMKDAMPGVKI